MTTAVDTNVIVGLWDRDPILSAAAQRALDAAQDLGPLVAAALVFSELMPAPGRDSAFLDRFFQSTSIRVDWHISEGVWRAAGQAFRSYASRRGTRHPGPRRILADFVIGAHAAVNGFHLLTLDSEIYAAAFPDLAIERV